MPGLELGNDQLELVEELRVLGIIFRSDLKWTSNTENIIKRASNKLWTLRRLKGLGAQSQDLVDIYIKQCRSILEFAVPAWQGAITVAERLDIERVQKGALHIILGDQYENYQNALHITNLEDLESRRNKLCFKFAQKAEKDDKHKKWFKPKSKNPTRQFNDKYWKPIAKTGRLKKSPICHLTNILNEHYQNPNQK